MFYMGYNGARSLGETLGDPPNRQIHRHSSTNTPTHSNNHSNHLTGHQSPGQRTESGALSMEGRSSLLNMIFRVYQNRKRPNLYAAPYCQRGHLTCPGDTPDSYHLQSPSATGLNPATAKRTTTEKSQLCDQAEDTMAHG